MNWKHAANYVCKQYIDNVSRDVYFDDVRLQMDAKLWGEEYNRYNPPKKVCCNIRKSRSLGRIKIDQFNTLNNKG